MHHFHDTRALHRAGLTTTVILAAGLAVRPSFAGGSGHDGYEFSVVATLDEEPPGDDRHHGYSFPWPLVHLNDRGQVLTQVILTSGVTHVVVATPD
ncbi:hypothetical protein WME90_24605 [Sorangium sp. So ce375]|uniref:hypothetical protein n=1 Tax=Sorangium sp. So ce375 TaxID=3133306 RepID=UPI003F5C59C9